MFAIDIVITYITVRNQMISTIHFNTAGYLHDGAQARVNVRRAGCKGQEQKQFFHLFRTFMIISSMRGGGVLDVEYSGPISIRLTLCGSVFRN